MKKLILTLTVASLVVFTSCKENASRQKSTKKTLLKQLKEMRKLLFFQPLSFDKTEHDFGQIMNGTPVETVFSYTNSGKSPLVVTDIKSTCGCTVPQGWSREPLNARSIVSVYV